MEIYRRLVIAAPERYLPPLRALLALQANLLLERGRLQDAQAIRAWLETNDK